MRHHQSNGIYTYDWMVKDSTRLGMYIFLDHGSAILLEHIWLISAQWVAIG